LLHIFAENLIRGNNVQHKTSLKLITFKIKLILHLFSNFFEKWDTPYMACEMQRGSDCMQPELQRCRLAV